MMTYHANTQPIVQFSLFLLFISPMTLNQDTVMLYFLIPAAIAILATAFMDFKFKIMDGRLTFQIRVFSLSLYKKVVSHNQVNSMKFKRVGWAKKCVVVKNDKGFNFRIINFRPDTLYDDLIDFANEYDIHISKTKDYMILEK